LAAVKIRAPVLGGNFGVWGGMFSTFDCSLAYLRQKEDPWNSILSGAMTSGCLTMRAGPRAMATSTVFGGVILALIEGAGIMLNRMYAEQSRPVRQDSFPVAPPPPAQEPKSSSASSSGGSMGETDEFSSSTSTGSHYENATL
jgi:import inner membrane translocase subunit TIM17